MTYVDRPVRIDPVATARAAGAQLKRLQDERGIEPPAPLKARPWPKKPARLPMRSERLGVWLDVVTHQEICDRAEAKGILPARLAGLIIEAVARDELWDALLSGEQ